MIDMSPFGDGKQHVSATTAHPRLTCRNASAERRDVYLNQGSFRSSQVRSA